MKVVMLKQLSACVCIRSELFKTRDLGDFKTTSKMSLIPSENYSCLLNFIRWDILTKKL